MPWIPLDTVTLEAHLDLFEGETTFPGYDTQNVSVGLEWDVFHIVALRLGAYATDSYEYDGDDVPQEAKVAAVLSVNF